MIKIKPYFPLFIIYISLSNYLLAQNINGEKIIAGRESITVINFPDKVLNINFSDDDAYDYYIPKRREDKSISIQFNKEKRTGPNTGLLVNEGGRSHMFRLIFDSTYNINDDTRPPLWYDHSNLKALKAFVQKQKELEKLTAEEQEKALKQQEKEAAEDRKKEVLAAQKQAETDAAQKTKDLEKHRKEQEEKQKQSTAEIAKAKKDAEATEKQMKLAAAKEAEEKNLADQKAKQDADMLAKQKADEEKQLKALKDKHKAEALVRDEELKRIKDQKDADALAKAEREKELKEQKASEALAKAEREAEERKRLQEEKLSKQKVLDEEKRKKAEAELARKEAEKKAAAERLAQLEEDRKQREKEKPIRKSDCGNATEKKGIDLYNFPRQQINTVISDFFIIGDTLRNYRISDSLMKTDLPNKVNIEASGLTDKDIKVTLENIYFKDIYTYYKIKIDNNSNEDFLGGTTYLYWYDANEKAKQVIKSSYLTYINFYPVIRPKTTQDIIFVTRSPNMVDNESLVLFIEERRKEKGIASIIIPGEKYNKELARFQNSINPKQSKDTKSKKTDKKEKNKKKN
ncbi:MAG: hypothetical protein IPH58_10005 [Sphingobacteriales bacterium]|nr:hypothetical protein [Sphingobacteriales bacterium]